MKRRANNLSQSILRAKRWSASILSPSLTLSQYHFHLSLTLLFYLSFIFSFSCNLLFISHPHSCTITRIYAHKSTLFHTDLLPSHRTRYVNTCQVFKDYFGELEEESIRDNFVVVYELLDETMDFGYPQTCESRILREWVSQPSYLAGCTSFIYLICSLEGNRQAGSNLCDVTWSDRRESMGVLIE